MIRKHGFLGAKPSADAFAETLRVWLDHRCEHTLFRPASVTRDGDRVHVVAFVHPAGGEIVVELDDRDRITLESTTNPVGPGFHAFVCDAIDAIGEELKVRWSSVEDDTGFFEHRDFNRLQSEMTSWLQHVATICVERMSDHSNLAVSMPISAQPQLQPGMVSMPAGPRPLSWMRSVAGKQSDGKEFFSWWDRGWTVDERVKWTRAALWNLTSFERPQNQEEANLQQLVLRHAAELVTDGADFGPMAADLTDLSRAEGGTYDHLFTDHAGGGEIGYRRLPMTHSIARGWTITLPGHFAIVVEDNTWIAYDNDRTVRFSSYEIQSDEPSEKFFDSLSVFDGFEALPLESQDGTVYRVSYGPGTPEDECDWLIRCEAANLPDLGSLTIAVSSPHRDWAFDTAKQLKFTRRA
ncbi:MAG: hypothetical protein LAT64_06330 [Phycisphaerales bacterium]|nr:hypothetical protein [Planctomycetota bacterium]MCH8508372.1 hypothetical protein [Phycisphaerales bacterium]